MKPHPRKAIVDTNLLLLWLVARTDARLLQTFKRVQAFTYADIRLLNDLLTVYPHSITTPHVLSETNNFIDQAPRTYRNKLTDELKLFVRHAVEIFTEAKILIVREEFNLLGVTDTAMAQLSSEAMVMTVDYRLTGKIVAMGGNAINFNHYRSGLLRTYRP